MVSTKKNSINLQYLWRKNLESFFSFVEVIAKEKFVKDANKEQIQIANELKETGKGKMPVEKYLFLKNIELLISAREKISNKES